MKRCPQCNRVEADETLSFCRSDGATLVTDSSEVETSLLPDAATDPGRVRSTGPTTALPEAAAQASTQQSPVRRHVASTRNSLIAGAIGVLLVTALGVGSYWKYGRSGNEINSIAVMPFVNESGNAEVDYLSDGMTDTLISNLSQLTNLSVKARSSVFRYKGKETDPTTIGKELDVEAILNGRFAQRGDQVTLTLELVNAQTENVIWSEQYNRPLADLVNLQTEIARDVSSKLVTKLSGAETQKLTKTYTSNPEAYRLYLQGRFYWNKREEKDFRTAVQFFDRAIAVDQNYALAHAGRADAYALLGTFGFIPPAEALPKARESARRASVLDATLAEPHATLAYLLYDYDYDFVAAEREFRRAIELNPNYATAHHWLGELLTSLGRLSEAEVEFRRALELEPLSLPINWDLGRFFYHSRRFDESLVQHKKTIELDPGFARAHRTLAEVYRVKGDYANAVEERAKFFELVGQSENAGLIRAAFAKDGWPGFLRLVTAENSPLRDSNNPWALAKAYIDLGDKDKAIAELEKVYQLRLSSVIWFKIEPQMDPLRSDPRFQELLKKIGF